MYLINKIHKIVHRAIMTTNERLSDLKANIDLKVYRYRINETADSYISLQRIILGEFRSTGEY
jgi:hypothetical protein